MNNDKPDLGTGKAGDFAKHTAKKTAGKISEKLVSWLKKVLWEKPVEYIKLKGKKYLKIAGSKSKGTAKIVAESDVPSKYQRKISEKLKGAVRGVAERPQKSGGSRPRSRTVKQGDEDTGKGRSGLPGPEPFPDPRKSQDSRPVSGFKNSKEKDRRRREERRRPYRDDSVDPKRVVDEEMDGEELPAEVKKQLKDAPPEVVAELAADDQRIRSHVLKNPELVDASSRSEAAQKIEIMGGAGVSGLPEFSTGHGSGDIEGLLDDLGPQWGARLGHNEMGDNLADAVNEASAGGDGDGSDGEGPTSALTGGELAGTASGSVDTGTGSTSISTGSSSSGSGGASNGVGNSGGAGNGLGSGSGGIGGSGT